MLYSSLKNVALILAIFFSNSKYIYKCYNKAIYETLYCLLKDFKYLIFTFIYLKYYLKLSSIVSILIILAQLVCCCLYFDTIVYCYILLLYAIYYILYTVYYYILLLLLLYTIICYIIIYYFILLYLVSFCIR